MAKKKTSKKSALVPVASSNDLVIPANWADKLAAMAKADEATATSDGGWGMISLKDGVFTFNEDILDSPLSVIILGASFENLKYPAEYDPNKMTGVSCYALGTDQGTLAPPEDLESKESDSCATCWANVFGSGKRGTGKACSNKVRLTVLPFDADENDADDMGKVSGARLRIPPTALKNWSAFNKRVTQGMKLPLMAVATNITVEPGGKNQLTLEFDPYGVVTTPEFLEALEGRLDESKDQLALPPALAGAEAEADTSPRPGRSAGVARKKVVRKSSGAKKAPAKKKKTTKKAASKKTMPRKF